MGWTPGTDRETEPSTAAFHRTMYVDLVRAYLVDYGSQRKLARALGVTDAFLSYLLEPHRVAGARRRPAAWIDTVRRSDIDLSEATKYLKVPSASKATSIAHLLTSDQERREALLYHMDRARSLAKVARRRAAREQRDPVCQSHVRLRAEMDAVGRIHAVALASTTSAATRSAYADVWVRASDALRDVDLSAFPAEAASLLMFLHDAASVIGRHDLALRHARFATLCLADSSSTDEIVRLRTNALLAEVVTLNNLGMPRDALVLADHSRLELGYETETSQWKRSFLEQRLSAIGKLARPSVHDAEATADAAVELAADRTVQVGVYCFLLRAYCAHGSRPSLRRATMLADELRPLALRSSLPSVRQVRLLRTLALLHGALGDMSTWMAYLLDATDVASSAGLLDQSMALARQLAAAPGAR